MSLPDKRTTKSTCGQPVTEDRRLERKRSINDREILEERHLFIKVNFLESRYLE